MAQGKRDACALRAHRASSWIRRAESLLPSDLDGRFIFYWIAFGALYGRPKYLQSGPDRTPEESDIEVFLKVVSRLDKENAGLRLVGELHKQVDALVRDKFLNNHCWRQWHKQGVVRGSERVTSCLEPPDPRPVLLRLVSRLYVLRNQMFHGCRQTAVERTAGHLGTPSPFSLSLCPSSAISCGRPILAIPSLRRRRWKLGTDSRRAN